MLGLSFTYCKFLKNAHVSVCALHTVCAVPVVTKEGARFLKPGVVGSHEPLDVGSSN